MLTTAPNALKPAEPASPKSTLQRKCSCESLGETCSRCGAKQQSLQRMSSGTPTAAKDREPQDTSSNVSSVLESQGRQLASPMRARMEAALGHDFSSVRVHSDPAANASAEALDAHAYTVGNHVVLGDPVAEHGNAGLALMAHELTHVVQQSKGGVPTGIDSEARLEREADRAADNVIRGAPVQLGESSVPHVARQAKGKRSAEAPGVVDAVGSPGLVILRVRGEVIAVISYSPKAGAANFDTFRERGREGATVVTPADSNASFALGPTYARHQQAGDISFSDVPSDLEWDALGESGAPLAATEHVGRVYRLVVRSAPPAAKDLSKATSQTAQATAPVVATPKKQVAMPTFEAKDGKALADESSTLVSLDEDKLANALLAQVRNGHIQAVEQALDAIGTTNRDDVAVAFCAGASVADLEQLAKTEAGKQVLLRLYDELTSGHLADDEKAQADRIMKARSQAIDPAKVLDADTKAPVIPFSTLGFTKFSSASLTVKRLPNGKIWVRSHMKTEHWKDAKRMPTSTFALGQGAELDPDQIVGLYLYDEGGKTIYRPAIYLLQLSNQEDTKAGTMAGEAIFTGLTLGVGGGAVASTKVVRGVWAARGATALRVADSGAAVIGVVGILINDHRGLILKHFGADGQTFLDAWQKVETVTAIYGMGRGAVAGAKVINDLRKAFGVWKARRAKLPQLTAAEGAALDGVAAETEATLENLETQRAKRGAPPEHEPPAQGPRLGDLEADAVAVVEKNPGLVKGEPGQRRARISPEHEIVEVPTAGGGIGCELHSPPPFPKVPCPIGMGKTDMSSAKSGPSSPGAGSAVKSAIDHRLQGEGNLRAAARETHDLAHMSPSDVINPGKLKSSFARTQSTVAIAEVEVPLANGSINVIAYGSASGNRLSPVQQRALDELGVRIVRGAGHAEENIAAALPPGSKVRRWGISWGGAQKPDPCDAICKPIVAKWGGKVER